MDILHEGKCNITQRTLSGNKTYHPPTHLYVQALNELGNLNKTYLKILKRLLNFDVGLKIFLKSRFYVALAHKTEHTIH